MSMVTGLFVGTIVTTSTRGIVWLGMWIHVVLGIPFQASLRVLLSKGCIEPSFLAVRGVFTPHADSNVELVVQDSSQTSFLGFLMLTDISSRRTFHKLFP